MNTFFTLSTHSITTRLLRGIGLTGLLFALAATTALAQTARVQVIHNAPDPAASVVDVYLGDSLAIDDFAFRSATPYLDLPAGEELTIGVAPGTSASASEALATFPVTLTADETYSVIASGVLDPSGFAENPGGEEIGFTLRIKNAAREASTDTAAVQFNAVHGSPDAPLIDITFEGGLVIIDGIAYKDVTSYVTVSPVEFILNITPADNNAMVLAAFEADLTSLAGEAVALMVSGFLEPSANQDGPALALLAILPDGTVVEFPATEIPDNGEGQTARVQVIHNAPDPAASVVDVYLGDSLAIDDFAFRSATPYFDVPTGATLTIGIAPGTSTSASEALASFPVTLRGGRTYSAIASGVLDPSGFAENPSGEATDFTLLFNETAREASTDTATVQFNAVHGSPDTPFIDVTFEEGSVIVDGFVYGDVTSYVTVSPEDFILNITPGEDNATVLAAFEADLTSLAGEAVALMVSGFLEPSANQDGPALALIGVLADGTVVEFPAAEIPDNGEGQTARVQVIHNAPDPAAAVVDVYLGDSLALDDFAFRSATPYLDLPAGEALTIGVAPGTSTSAGEALATFPVTLTAGATYSVIASGVLDASGFAANPSGEEIGFTLLVNEAARETSSDSAAVEFFAVHGSPDAPAVDVIAREVAPVVEDAVYGDVTDYVAVPAMAYTLDVTPAEDNAVVVASFEVDVTGLAGTTAVVLASGFLEPSANQGGPAFALIAVLPDGTVVNATPTPNEGVDELPARFTLQGNYPNPFNPTTNVLVDLPQQAEVGVTIYNALGQQVLQIPVQRMAAGLNQSIAVDAGTLPSGLYLYEVRAETVGAAQVETGRMMLLK